MNDGVHHLARLLAADRVVSNPLFRCKICLDAVLDIGATGMIRDWLRSSMGVFGCFGICVGLFCLAVWIMWQIMESMGPG